LDLQISGDGSDRLDFTYVEDVIQGVVRAIERPEARNQIFNLTFGGSRSISQMVEILPRAFPQHHRQEHAKDKLMPDRGTLSIARRASSSVRAGLSPRNRLPTLYRLVQESLRPQRHLAAQGDLSVFVREIFLTGIVGHPAFRVA